MCLDFFICVEVNHQYTEPVMELDYVYRSKASDMSPAVDVCWMSSESNQLLAVGFQSGLVEVIDVDNRELRSSHRMDKPVTGLCAVDDSLLLIQTKSDSLSLFNTEWKIQWSVSTKTAVSFSRPAVAGGRIVCCVIAGQWTLGFVNIETGNLESKIDLSLVVPSSSNPGSVVSIITRMSPCGEEDSFVVLVETGHLVEIAWDGKLYVFKRVLSIPFPEGSVIPTTLAMGTTGEVLVVGFSDGSVLRQETKTDRSFEKLFPSGVGAVEISGQKLICGDWTGNVTLTDDQPHIASIRSIVCRQHRVAIASTDGRVSLWFLNP